MFAGSCIGVIFLVISLAALRRFHKAYDASVARSFHLRYRTVAHVRDTAIRINPRDRPVSQKDPPTGEQFGTSESIGEVARSGGIAILHPTMWQQMGRKTGHGVARPTIWQQLIRAGLYTVEFAVAYFVMLLAMYFNGYIIISILIGAFLGSLAFDWDLACG